MTWKTDFNETKRRYIDWWNGRGIVLTMWEHIFKDGEPYKNISAPPPAHDFTQYWFDAEWRSAFLDWQMSRNSYRADILPVANTQLGPGSLAAILGAELEGREETIWIREPQSFDGTVMFNENNRWWLLHKDLLTRCVEKSSGNYLVGCPDLVEGLDVLASLKGSDNALLDLMMQPDLVMQQLRAVNDAYFRVFDEIYDIINADGEMAFCYFSLWAPGKCSKLQCDISVMISEDDFRAFALPFLREQTEKIDYTLYHLDGVDAIRHLDALLELDKLNAIQWTPGEGQPQGGDRRWYDLYRKILAGGKSVMANWVQPSELEPLIDNVGNQGLHINVDFHSEKEIEQAIRIVEKYRRN